MIYFYFENNVKYFYIFPKVFNQMGIIKQKHVGFGKKIFHVNSLINIQSTRV